MGFAQTRVIVESIQMIYRNPIIMMIAAAQIHFVQSPMRNTRRKKTTPTVPGLLSVENAPVYSSDITPSMCNNQMKMLKILRYRLKVAMM